MSLERLKLKCSSLLTYGILCLDLCLKVAKWTLKHPDA